MSALLSRRFPTLTVPAAALPMFLTAPAALGGFIGATVTHTYERPLGSVDYGPQSAIVASPDIEFVRDMWAINTYQADIDDTTIRLVNTLVDQLGPAQTSQGHHFQFSGAPDILAVSIDPSSASTTLNAGIIFDADGVFIDLNSAYFKNPGDFILLNVTFEPSAVPLPPAFFAGLAAGAMVMTRKVRVRRGHLR